MDMLQTKQLSVKQRIKETIDEALKLQKKYISYVEKIDYVDPISFYTINKHQKLNRFFWQQSDQSVTYVGIGLLRSFTQTETEEDRYLTIQNKWKNFLEVTHINDPHNSHGPVLFGGFSFFDDEKGNDKWTSFPNSEMIVPKMMLTVHENGTCYLTYNLSVEEDQIIDEIENLQKKLSKKGNQSHHDEQTIEQINVLEYEKWERLITNAVDTIKSGHLGKVVLARELETHFSRPISVEAVLTQLKKEQKDSYIFSFDNGEDVFIGATPERLVYVEGNALLSTCLAGTISRGKNEEEDDIQAWKLLNDEKNLQEHQYVVNMIKDAIEPYCEDVNIPNQPKIYRLKSLQHLYTPVTAQLLNGFTIFDIVRQLHPTPALGGEPKEKALNYIQEHEPFSRGWYAAPIGWVDAKWNGEFAVAIRSALIQNQRATLFAGCGIVKDSSPKEEFEETNLKFTPMLEALGGKPE